ncbi:hypothetical protein ALI22I_34080 [Saccharothrix sp. ALI-22-I]|nr:hypothetical protein ALI22I_34080 [Saccharothrix sp. ALI-22-I]
MTNNTLSLVRGERISQDAQWGVLDHPDGTGPAFAAMLKDWREYVDMAATYGMLTWRDILVEELFEVLCEQDPERLGTELVQLAGVAVAWREHLHRRGAAPVVAAA